MTHFFPHHLRGTLSQRLLSASMCAALLTALLPPIALAAPTSDGLAREREELAAEADQIAEERQELEGALAGAQEHLEELGQEIAVIQQNLMDTEEELENTRNDIAETNQKIDETTAQLAERREALGTHMRNSYKIGPSVLVDTLLGATSFEDLINRIYYLDKISNARARDIEEINTLQDELTTHQQELEKVEATQQAAIETIEEQAAEYEAKIEEAQAYYDTLDAEVQAKIAEEEAKRAEEAAKKAEEDAKRAEEEEERKAAEQRARQSSGITTTIDAINESKQGPVEAPAGSSDIVANAYSFIGKPYKKWWLGRNYGPDADGFDCCGLVCTAYHMAGYSTPYQTPVAGLMEWVRSRGNWKDCNLSNIDQMLNPGDLVFCSTGHVAIYIGNSMMIHAPVPGRYVCVAPVYACIGGGFGG